MRTALLHVILFIVIVSGHYVVNQVFFSIGIERRAVHLRRKNLFLDSHNVNHLLQTFTPTLRNAIQMNGVANVNQGCSYSKCSHIFYHVTE